MITITQTTAKIVVIVVVLFSLFNEHCLQRQHVRSLAAYSKYRDMVRLGNEAPQVLHHEKVVW